MLAVASKACPDYMNGPVQAKKGLTQKGLKSNKSKPLKTLNVIAAYMQPDKPDMPAENAKII